MEIVYNLKQIDKAVNFVLEQAKFKTLIFKAEMGTGKTTLIKQLVKALGCEDEVSSPTFSIVNEYEGLTSTIYHFDLYRIEEETELYDFGIETYLDSDAYIFVEWPELLEPLLDNYTEVSIYTNENQDRVLQLKNSN
ncbi:tRNA (adenosine(37)-N6)-threonylcarbamoyltransferase complex ATPase subunit type 1 TsaE [Aurantibacter aestuarii]|uniref:tRNA threonylcarbamoyladenosine biosynthesis protein TsaE n=1 Tax=Aurantibacter aestuarii TaxID=1266046 RepID=A0A2T1N8P7_9FLAO|nr:tRNA (adenosine(37)-N6)-threonylcarbamoyltransferase complex ATPase subunit type 1 TsaE [Aurantibacter aestuarii]PSG88250.1 tRNA (adenosine(37)-N6)-threonylcarbamoyltransferase complex ATPase subunit type 1 TsaE [Aurantibacter aestuarii]